MRVLLTGSSGTIGSVILKEIADVEFVCFDLPEHDATNFQDLRSMSENCDAIVHLAWDSKHEDWNTNDISKDTAQMALHVYQAAIQNKIPRVVIASSVHADDAKFRDTSKLMNPYTLPIPDSPYGAGKVHMEALGRHFAKKGLEVVCIRFGGVNSEDVPKNDLGGDDDGKKRWLSHRDCGSLINCILRANSIPNGFVIVYGISNNTGLIYDISNPFKWVPQDDASQVVV